MKKTLLYYGLPFALLILTSLLIPNIQYNYFNGSMFNAGLLLGIVHLLAVAAFVLACMVPLGVQLYDAFKTFKKWR